MRAPSQLLDVNEAARKLNLSPRRVRLLFDAREFPIVKIRGRVYVSPSDLADYLTAHRSNVANGPAEPIRPDDLQLLDCAQAAQALDMPTGRMRLLFDAREFPIVKIRGRVYVTPGDLAAYIHANRCEPQR